MMVNCSGARALLRVGADVSQVENSNFPIRISILIKLNMEG